MSILSTLESTVQGLPNASAPAGTTGTPGGAVLTQLIAFLESRPGGLAGVVQSFEQGGLGHVVQSWIGTGANLPVSADQLRNVLGSDLVTRITGATGLSEAQVEQHITAALPQIIDHLSPGGRLHQGDLSSALAGIAERFLHR